ncbi:putative VQ motif-containing protein [Helianthus annuus]|uniref:VQ motif-containing protein 22-like n=1 Tax=Helianthus annuus TaxID=4232 RepID=UPI000B8F9135|nr:VQ motif-containing protein 22-like [Helianthus annuus]KAJ0494801.1 putative VQ motif-containing protein [Helianthus annuus]KAJ0867922.1 putative VQ motif-containing protein [Helianthus annuus]
MDGMNHFPTDEWIQQYPNTAMAGAGGEPYDATSTAIYRDSSQGTTAQAGEAGPKPIRRRSRASRRTPVTVLNASPTEFRALVQRFTGCDSKENAASASMVNLPKGPVNIDFARNDATESSSRYAYFDNQARSSLQAEQVQQVGGWNHLQAGYGIQNAPGMHESIDESSLMAPQRDGGNHGYNV